MNYLFFSSWICWVCVGLSLNVSVLFRFGSIPSFLFWLGSSLWLELICPSDSVLCLSRTGSVWMLIVGKKWISWCIGYGYCDIVLESSGNLLFWSNLEKKKKFKCCSSCCSWGSYFLLVFGKFDLKNRERNGSSVCVMLIGE